MNLLIVDDELLVRTGVQGAIDWESTDYTVAGDAKSAEEALALIPALEPVIVISDVVMGPMDGLDLIARSRRAGYRAEFVVLTSHRDFDFARRALEVGAVEYLLKHELTRERLLPALDRAASRLTVAAAPNARHPDVDGSTNSTSRPATRRRLAVVVDDYHRRLQRRDDPDPAAMRAMGISLVARLSAPHAQARFLDGSEGFWEFELGFPAASPADRPRALREYASRLRGRFESFMNLHVRIVISEPVTGGGADVTPRSRFDIGFSSERVDLVADGFAADGSVDGRDHETYDGSSRHLLARALAEVIAGIRSTDRDKLRGWVGTFIAAAREGRASRSVVIAGATTVAAEIVARTRGAVDTDASDRPTGVASRLHDAAYLSSVQVVLEDLADRLARHEERPATPDVPDELRRVMDHIDVHFDEPLSAEAMAELACKSVAYFSTFFRQHTGLPFTEYVNQTRVARAQALLVTDARPLKEIAVACGYQNEKYFHRVFKQVTGLTPAAYRSKNRAQPPVPDT